MAPRLIRFLYGAALFTLPWIGVGLMTLVTGRDLGAGLQPAWLLLAVVIAAAVVTRSGDLVVRPAGRTWLRWLAVAGLVVVLSGVGLWWAPSGVETETAVLRWMKQAIQLGVMLAFTVWAAVWTRGPDRWRFTLVWLAAGGVFQVVYGLLQAVEYGQPVGLLAPLETVFTSNPSILSGSAELYVGNGFLPIPRLRGTMCEPLFLGNYLVFLWPWLLWGGGLRRTRARILVGALFLLLMGTWARGAWLAAAGQLAVWVIWRWRAGRAPVPGGRALLGVVGAAGLVLILAAALGWSQVLLPWERLAQAFSRQDWSTLTRLYSMQAAWRAFLLSPLVGVGWGQFAFHFPLLVDPMGLQSQFSWPVVNNLPLQILCETGLVGIGVFFGFSGWLGRRIAAGLRSGLATVGRDRILAGVVSLVGVWLQLLTFSQYNLAHIWLALGLLIAALMESEKGEAA